MIKIYYFFSKVINGWNNYPKCGFSFICSNLYSTHFPLKNLLIIIEIAINDHKALTRWNEDLLESSWINNMGGLNFTINRLCTYMYDTKLAARQLLHATLWQGKLGKVYGRMLKIKDKGIVSTGFAKKTYFLLTNVVTALSFKGETTSITVCGIKGKTLISSCF